MMVSLLLLLCAAAPDWAAWLEDAAATIAPIDDVDVAAADAGHPAQRVGSAAAAVAPPIGRLRPPVPRVVDRPSAPPTEVPRPEPVQGEGGVTARGPPRR
ncbi:MAG: hypothetical protein A2138_11325 [Deltaproteobacteria bacterium RBG_16_71_12]|nr:MAG: hypothetical protein A2138_11325 [Deltaproteobacteria bacterium RBG_16_71_12]